MRSTCILPFGYDRNDARKARPTDPSPIIRGLASPRRRRVLRPDPASRVGHDWYGFGPDGESVQPTGPAGLFAAETRANGAALAGRRTVEQVDHWGGDSHGVPIFVPSHRPPGPSVANYPLVTYVTDGIVSAMAQAKAAAGDRNVSRSDNRYPPSPSTTTVRSGW